ncbi:MAG TPA: hypothetical protein VJ438_01400, partial [Candidatus Nanoarchaeia archaeon]|nr:hypothetical protein [Candidatus Nanoarchaeia archaeon]
KYDLIRKIKKGVTENRNQIVLIATGILSVGTGILSMGILFKIKDYLMSPHYSNVSTLFNGSSIVSFNDDLAPGMKAYVEYEQRMPGELPKKVKQEMSLFSKYETSCTFNIPEKALEAGEFTVSAIGMDGRESRPKKLYPLEGIVVENSPN